MLSGLAVGWRVHASLPEFVAGVALLLFVTFVMSWIGVWMGLNVPTVEVANQTGFKSGQRSDRRHQGAVGESEPVRRYRAMSR